HDMSGGIIAEQYDNAVGRAHQAIKEIFGLSVDELRPLVPEIDQWIKDDIALSTKLSLGKDANMAALVGESPMSTFRSLIDQTQVALLSDSSADTGAEAQSETPELQQDNAANGQTRKQTPAQEANAAVEETKTKGEQEKLKETANTLANVNSKLEDKTPEQQAAEKRASDLTTQAVSEINKGQQQTEDKQKIQLPVFTSGKQLAEWKKTASKEELAAWNAKVEEARKHRELEKLMKSQALNAIAHFADKEADAKEAEKAAFFKQYADKYRNSNRVNFDPADPESELSILLSLLHGEMDLSVNDFLEIFADKTTPAILHEITGKWQDSGAEDLDFLFNRSKAADTIAEKMIRGFFAKYGESISTEILNAKDPAAYTQNLSKKFFQYCDDNFELSPETKLNQDAKYWAEYCLQHVIEPIAYAKSNTVPHSGEERGHAYDPFKGKDAEALKVIKDVLGSKALRAVPFMHYAEISNAEAEALLSDETDIDSNDTDSG
ncbi:MAG: cell envelope integrity protein TolA, partial [Lachnospiraceae bacterium]|nr:cell envelope integrity protein TolA [Lachnospiraceae bacterium]